MGYVSHCRHDVFVSFAHVDDQPLPGAEQGWVTTLVEALERRLAQRLGREEAYSLWIDRELAGNARITPEILEALRGSATFLIVLSPGYLASEWCRRERDAILESVRALPGSRVFVVERDEVEAAEYPDELRDLRGYRFWIRDREGRAPRILGSPRPDPADREYYNLINDLSLELAGELRSLRDEPAAPAPSGPGARPAGPRVYVAHVTDDLEAQRNELRRYLEQAGLEPVPGAWYPLEREGFRAAMEADLEGAEVFVQLLSAASGPRPPDVPEGFARLQRDLAAAAGKRILQWRSAALDLDEVADPAQRELLELETVRAEGLEDFKREARRSALEPPEPPAAVPLNAFVFVDREEADQPLAEQICAVLDRAGADYSLPVRGASPAENRTDLEENLRTCDAVIVIYGLSTVTWVRRQLLECRKILAVRDRPLKALALFQGPPEEKEGLDLKLANLSVLDCRQGFDEGELRGFLDRVEPGVA